jgi:glycosyltransferase involved in cell wall biosynthesis
VISGSSQTATEIDTPRERVFLIPENGINETMIVERVFTEEEKPLELLFVGRLVPYKACDMAIEAAAPLLRDGRARFSIVGDGDERAALEALVERLGLQDRVRFFGMISHSETVEKFREADVLLFPSVREFGGGVVFEALATGTVPVVADYGGPGDIVEPEFGYKVQLSGESATKAQLTEILEALERDREHLRALSRAGQVHARKSLTWDGKAALTTEILEWVTGRAKKPSHLLADDQLAASRTRSVAPVEGESSATGLFSAS